MEIVYPAKKSIMLRDVWITDSREDTDQILLSVECLRCGGFPKVSLDKSFLRSECRCDSIFVSGAAYTSALPGVTIEDSLQQLNVPWFCIYLTGSGFLSRTEASLKEWLSCQVGVPADEIEINFTFK